MQVWRALDSVNQLIGDNMAMHCLWQHNLASQFTYKKGLKIHFCYNIVELE